MIVYIHSSDVTDAGRTFGRHSGRDVRHVTIPHGVRTEDVARQVLASFSSDDRSSANSSIDLLVINTHGSPGIIHMGGIEDDTYDVNYANAAIFASPFRPLLKSISTGGEGVEVHGCGVASGHINPRTNEVDDPYIGFRFVYALACGFNNRVRSSASPQVADREGLFEDSLVEAEPGEDLDWEGHVFAPRGTELVHAGGIMTRIEAAFGGITPSIPRTERFPAHPSWDRR